eukprot:TRINITY_DN6428_c2_g1_i2.p2 TRINITY_DN6428_c2_g1~~TRINITY_DN6428_c2_g1_i2.p2  ORF type:complete len:758 (+),score=235.92 TRINITY_DN6428_c2_g1_i2:801-3074(+)
MPAPGPPVPATNPQSAGPAVPRGGPPVLAASPPVLAAGPPVLGSGPPRVPGAVPPVPGGGQPFVPSTSQLPAFQVAGAAPPPGVAGVAAAAAAPAHVPAAGDWCPQPCGERQRPRAAPQVLPQPQLQAVQQPLAGVSEPAKAPPQPDMYSGGYGLAAPFDVQPQQQRQADSEWDRPRWTDNPAALVYSGEVDWSFAQTAAPAPPSSLNLRTAPPSSGLNVAAKEFDPARGMRWAAAAKVPPSDGPLDSGSTGSLSPRGQAADTLLPATPPPEEDGERGHDRADARGALSPQISSPSAGDGPAAEMRRAAESATALLRELESAQQKPPAPQRRSYIPSAKAREAAQAAADPYRVTGAPAAEQHGPGVNAAAAVEPPALYSRGLPEPLGIPPARAPEAAHAEHVGGADAQKRAKKASGAKADKAAKAAERADRVEDTQQPADTRPLPAEADKRRWGHAGLDRGVFGSAAGARSTRPARADTPPRAQPPKQPSEGAAAQGRKPTWSEVAAPSAKAELNGGPELTSGFSWADAVDEEEDGSPPRHEPEGTWPDGLQYVDSFISAQEEKALLDWAKREAWVECPRTGRRTQQYGYVYDAARGRLKLDTARPLPRLPADVVPRMRTIREQLDVTPPSAPLHRCPDQLLVTEYTPGQGSPPSTDNLQVFDGFVSVVSLGADAEIDFVPLSRARARGCRPFRAAARRRSYMCLTGACRRDYQCAVVEQRAGSSRVALTFRRVWPDVGKEAKSAAEMLQQSLVQEA